MKRSLLLALAIALIQCVSAASVRNLALHGMGAHARSWLPGAAIIPGHVPGQANDGSFRSYWLARPENLPADLGLEWKQPQELSSVIVRYTDGRMARGPVVARTQDWVRLQRWEAGTWKDIEAEVLWQETASARYIFAPVLTSRIRLLFTESSDPEFRRGPDRLPIAVAELEAYKQAPFRVVSSGGRLVRFARQDHQAGYNEPPTRDVPYDIAGPLVVEPKQTRVFSDRLAPTLVVAESRWAKQPCAIVRTGTGVRLRNGFLELNISVTRRNQAAGVTRCYFIDLGPDIKPGSPSTLEVWLPIVSGLVFSGAYPSLPDQMEPQKTP
jgi:hypothetical protein